jgi:hypothetical protein
MYWCKLQGLHIFVNIFVKKIQLELWTQIGKKIHYENWKIAEDLSEDLHIYYAIKCISSQMIMQTISADFILQYNYQHSM